MAVAIVSGVNQVNEVRNNGAWSQGKNVIQGWYLYSKRNLALGETPGNLNLFFTGVNVLCDTDLADTTIPNAFGVSSNAGAVPEVV